MAKITRKELIKAAEDLNKVLGLKDDSAIPITSKITVEELSDYLRGTAECLKKGMNVKKSTINTLLDVEADVPADLTVKKVGVIETIFNIVSNAKEAKPVSKETILKSLTKAFPDRDADSMAKTIQAQLPKRMSKERGIKIIKTDEGLFFCK